MMLLACSSKPQTSPNFEPPEIPIDPSLLVYDEKALPITDDMTLNEALTVIVNNHRVYAEYIIHYRGLVDAINRRKKKESPVP